MVIRLRGRGCWATVAGQGSSARIDCFRCGRPVGGDRKDFASLDGSVVNHRTAKECGEEDILRKRSPSFRFGPEGGGRLIVLFFFCLLASSLAQFGLFLFFCFSVANEHIPQAGCTLCPGSVSIPDPAPFPPTNWGTVSSRSPGKHPILWVAASPGSKHLELMCVICSISQRHRPHRSPH